MTVDDLKKYFGLKIPWSIGALAVADCEVLGFDPVAGFDIAAGVFLLYSAEADSYAAGHTAEGHDMPSRDYIGTVKTGGSGHCWAYYDDVIDLIKEAYKAAHPKPVDPEMQEAIRRVHERLKGPTPRFPSDEKEEDPDDPVEQFRKAWKPVSEA